MNVSYFSVYDYKTESFGQLYPAQTPGAAERAFADSMKDPNSMAAKYPQDFALFQVLVFDDAAGVVVDSFTPPRLVVQASALVPAPSVPA